MNLQDFTKKKKIIKSIRFELKPIGKTRETLEKRQAIQNDMGTKELAAKVKIAGDCFYRDLIQSFAEECSLDCWDSLGTAYETSREDISSYRKASDNAKSQFLKAFTTYCSHMELSGAKFIENTLRDYVKNEDNEDYDRNLTLVYIDQLKGKVSASFKSYFTSWERIMFGDGCGSVTGRTLENFELFCSNVVLFHKIKEQCPEIVRTMSANFDIQLFEDYKKFNSCISQTGIQVYNELISGRYDNAGNCIASGINALLNKARQKDSSIHVHKFVTLKKQILAKQEKAFSIDTIDSVDSLKDTMQYVLHQSDVLSNTLNLFTTISKRNTDEIYICGANLNNVSASLLHDHSVLPDNILEEKTKELLKAKAESGKKASLTEKESALLKNSLKTTDYPISYISSLISKNMSDKQINICNWIFDELESRFSQYKSCRNLLEQDSFWDKDSKPDGSSAKHIREFLDSIIDIQHFLKIFRVRDLELPVDYEFYDQLEDILSVLSNINHAYNKIRNYMTRKVNQAAKQVQLCFGNPVFLSRGWYLKNEAKLGNQDHALLKCDGKFYYIVPAGKKREPLFIYDEKPCERTYEYVNIDKQSGAIKSLAKIVAAACKRNAENLDSGLFFTYETGEAIMTPQVYDIFKNKSYSDSIDDLHLLIRFYKDLLQVHPSYQKFDFTGLKRTEEYVSLKEFGDDVDARTYLVSTRYMDADAVDRAVSAGELYMFLITSADMYKENPKDMTAIYFRTFMGEENKRNISVKLNAGPNVFYRSPAISNKTAHKKGSILVRKTYDIGNGMVGRVPDNIYMELYHYYNGKTDHLSDEAVKWKDKVKTRTAQYDIVKDKRYMREMFTITFSVEINPDISKETNAGQLNNSVKEYIKAEHPNILAIQRGYRNILYYTLTDYNGVFIDSGPLNVIDGVNYRDMLKSISDDKRSDQLNWSYEKSAVDIKDSYLGMITSRIVKLAIDNNAIICTELLNDQIKDKRSIVDNQAFKKFESKLVNKLSCYSDKDIPAGQPGSVTCPLQLATTDCLSPIQNGILFFISPAYTKGICPYTGFVNLMNFSGITSVKRKRDFLMKMKEIRFNATKDVFEYVFSYADMPTYLSDKEQKAINELSHEWTVHTKGERAEYDKNKHIYNMINGTAYLKEVFSNTNTDYMSKITIEDLSSDEIAALFKIFMLYINGYVSACKQNPTAYYISPVSDYVSTIAGRTTESLSCENMAQKMAYAFQRMEAGENKYAVDKVLWLNWILQKGSD